MNGNETLQRNFGSQMLAGVLIHESMNNELILIHWNERIEKFSICSLNMNFVSRLSISPRLCFN